MKFLVSHSINGKAFLLVYQIRVLVVLVILLVLAFFNMANKNIVFSHISRKERGKDLLAKGFEFLNNSLLPG